MISFVLNYSFFFCKQNTAYEVRISDWSSDVCSSDLVPTLAEAAGLPDFEMSVFYAVWTPARTPADIQQRLAVELQRIVGAPDFQARQIGRSPCGGRVCQY